MTSGLSDLKKFDKRQLFRFFVDGRFQQRYNGWSGYEAQEAGSTEGMLRGYKYMLENFDLSDGISLHYLRNLHHQCMFNVHSTLSESAPGDLRCEETGFKFFSSRTTIEFLKELFEIRKTDGVKLFHNGGCEKSAKDLDVYTVYKRLMVRKRLQFNPWYPEIDEQTKVDFEQKGSLVSFYQAKGHIQLQFAKKFQSIVEKFNTQMAQWSEQDDKILLIAGFIQEVELLHPFPDGNCRTLQTLTNHLLMFHGITPSIIENPNYDGTYSRAEYAHEIRKGILETEKLLKDPECEVYNYTIRSASKEELESFAIKSDALIKEIEKVKDPAQNVQDENEIYLTPDIISTVTEGIWHNGNTNLRFVGVGAHTNIKPGFLCYCVRLEDWREQGHDEQTIVKYLNEIFNKGALAIVVDRESYAKKLDKPIYVVKDVSAALRTAAIAVRETVNPKTVYVGGTVGKTGFKTQLAHILKPITKTHAALNSGNIKLPILYSLSSLHSDDKVEIVEVSGAAKFSWGASRSKIISPDICVITNLGQVHMDIHKNIEGLIRNKASAVEGLRSGGVCIINRDSDFHNQFLAVIKELRKDISIVTFGENDADAFIITKSFNHSKHGWDVVADIEGEEISYFMPFFQSHMPVQSVGALLVVKRLGYSINQAASNYKGVKAFETMGRFFEIAMSSGKKIFYYDQSLRGSIQGMRTAFADLKNLKSKGKIVALLGGTSIEEDGDFTKQQHQEMAELLNNSPIDKFYTTGPYLQYMLDDLDTVTKAKHIDHSDDKESLVRQISSDLDDGDLVFVMGSAYLRLGSIGAAILALGKRKLII